MDSLKYDSISALVRAAEERRQRISEVVLQDQAAAMQEDEAVLYERMRERFQIMREAVAHGMDPAQRSTSGLTGGEGAKMLVYSETGGLSGTFLTRAMARALAVAGCNAAMGRIVAAPTAGSCGILPGCLVSMYEDRGVPERAVVMAEFTAGAFGMVIAQRASVSGAQGGCQAECGAAAGMAAAALVELQGGTPQMCADACAMALVGQMGLVCDPVAGLVEIPCVKRNVSSLMLAFSSADVALAGIRAHVPADECIDAMRAVGDALPASLRETAGGGLAMTPTGLRLRERAFGDKG
ncbi:MAG: L-serine ammonia-lyase, iron-sulfur-dependent, subunit alpha [Oscillospiraceae bacterium]|nr:L-serine ammonia-lyase, iron-sulfur-dependent, subunit alpha [Oscillospiraceae bacterium]